MTDEEEARFFDKLIYAGDCWEFMGSRNPDGYGNFWAGGQCLKAHRVSYALHKGSIPEGLLVLHTCDNPACVNPEHLYVGTNADNTKDKVERGRMYPTDGANNPAAVLIESDIREIHRLLALGLPHKEIAAKFRISSSHISNIKHGRVWHEIYLELSNAQSN